MKKFLLLNFAFVILMSSCGKGTISPETEISSKEYQVTFNTSLAQYQTNFPDNIAKMQSVSSSTNSINVSSKLTDYITHFQFILVNEKNEDIASNIFYREADPNKPGEFKDFVMPSVKLKAGKYRAIFFGGNGAQLLWASDWVGLVSSNPTTDAFLSNQSFEIADTDLVVDATLKRIGGKIKVIVEDEWPAEVQTVSVNISSPKYYYFLKDELSKEGSTLSITKASGMSEEKFVLTQGSTPLIFDSKIIAYGRNNEVLYSKDLKQIKIERNKITTVTGKLFDTQAANENKTGFSVKIDVGMMGVNNQTF